MCGQSLIETLMTDNSTIAMKILELEVDHYVCEICKKKSYFVKRFTFLPCDPTNTI